MSELFLLRIQTRLKGKLTTCSFAMGLSFIISQSTVARLSRLLFYTLPLHGNNGSIFVY